MSKVKLLSMFYRDVSLPYRVRSDKGQIRVASHLHASHLVLKIRCIQSAKIKERTNENRNKEGRNQTTSIL